MVRCFTECVQLKVPTPPQRLAMFTNGLTCLLSPTLPPDACARIASSISSQAHAFLAGDVAALLRDIELPPPGATPEVWGRSSVRGCVCVCGCACLCVRERSAVYCSWVFWFVQLHALMQLQLLCESALVC